MQHEYSNSLKEIVNEIKIHRRVNDHQNIIKFFGVSKKETDKILEYSLVLEYADSGTLNTYLNKHFNELEWDDKFELALQLANAVLCLHENDIIHCDLHASNILIKEGKREKIVDGTPNGYSDLYTKCWKTKHEERPNAFEVVSTLRSIINYDALKVGSTPQSIILTKNNGNTIDVTDSNKNSLSSNETADTNMINLVINDMIRSLSIHEVDSINCSTTISSETKELSADFFEQYK
ncbi:unnamed protein product [Rhizophagus irregularis]|nr:unnamed protein product [Rhizophagus irregularis]